MKAHRRFAVLACVFSAALFAAADKAESAPVLYYDEFTLAADPIATALANLGHTTTEVTSEAAFVTALTSGSFDLVIFLEESTTHASARAAVATYLGGGGRVIYNTFSPGGFESGFEATASGTINEIPVTILPPLSSGLGSASFGLVNPTFGIYSVGYTPFGGGTALATFDSRDAAVILGNSGRTIINSMLTETFPSLTDEVQFYENEITLLLEGAAVVPEPSSLALAALGAFGLLTRARRRRKRQAA